MDGRSGLWANARAATPIRHAGGGPPRCSSKRCRPSKRFVSPRAWAFTLLGLDAYCAKPRIAVAYLAICAICWRRG